MNIKMRKRGAVVQMSFWSAVVEAVLLGPAGSATVAARVCEAVVSPASLNSAVVEVVAIIVGSGLFPVEYWRVFQL